MRQFLGYSEEELIQKRFGDVTHPDDVASSEHQFERLMSGVVPSYQLEKRYRHKQGHDLWGLASVSLLRDENGSPRRLITQIQDVTELKRTELALHERERQYRRVFESTSDGLFVCASADRLVDVNPTGCAMFGRTREDMLRLDPDPRRLIHPDSYPVFAQLSDAITTSTEFHGELKGIRDDGSVFDAEVFGTPYTMQGENQFLASVRDVTERKTAERALAHSVQELEAFAYSVAHDLKAPLRAIQGFSEILQDDYRDRLDATGCEYLNYVGNGAARMGELIDDLLEYSRVGRGGLMFTPVDVAQVVQEAEQSLVADIEASGARIRISGTLPVLEGHRGILEQLFQNLIANAIKFTVPGKRPEIVISAQSEQRWHVISVLDNGIGIGEEYRQSIFDIFQRLHDADEYEGTGIGLAIVKKCVQLHGGAVSVEAGPDGGSNFLLRLPGTQLAVAA